MTSDAPRQRAHLVGTATDSWRRRFEVTMWAGFAVVVAAHTRADPDLFANVRFGLDLLDARAVTVAERYAFTASTPFMNHEWLSQVVMALVWLAGDGRALVALKVVLAALTWVPIDRVLAATAPHLRSAGPLLVVAALSTWGNNLRAQSFSFVAFAVLIWLLHRSREEPRMLWWLPLVFAIWVNLHGGWLVGGLVLAAWTGAHLLSAPRRRLGVTSLAVGITSLLATLANPYGFAMLEFLGTTVGFSRHDITDWQPIHRAGAAAAVTWAACCIVVLMATRSPGRPATPWLVVLLLLASASARVSRITVFFALVTVAVALPCALPRRESRRYDPMPRKAALGGIALAVVVASGMTWRNAGCIRMDGPWVPDLPTTRAMMTLPPGRMVTFFDWGHLLIWHRRGELHVSIDGRRETVYGDNVLRRHHALYLGEASAEAYPEELQADYVWLPRDFVVVDRLKARGWTPIAEGTRAALLSRPGGGQVPGGLTHATEETRCFPGP